MLPVDPGGPVLAQLGALALGTLVSEDLTCIAAGLLAARGDIDPWVAVLGSALGIYLGDLGLWLLGRLCGRALLELRAVRRKLPPARLDDLAERLDRNLATLVIASRFLPGTRLPLYLAAGVLGRRGVAFAGYSLLAVALWTPLLVLGSLGSGRALLEPLAARLPGGELGALGALGLGLAALVGVASRRSTPIERARLAASLARVWRWEFWPAWLFYLPLLPWIGWLSLRHRGFATITAANPAFPDGGFVGESKHAILERLPLTWTLASCPVAPGEPRRRLAALERGMAERGISFPLVLKPDAGQRGAGVRRVADAAAALAYLAAHPTPVLAQAYHPGPHEAGVFYVRFPDECRGRIFSITEKVFPVVVGDGRTSLEELVWRHRRYRMQASTFLARHRSERDRVLAAGERFPLGICGNHCQGTMFRDGGRLWTPELEARVDGIARAVPGFHFGRFDLRYGDEEAFRRGLDLRIVELNGVTSEATHVYDPGGTLLAAYRALFRQWRLLFEIGDRCRRLGGRPTPLGELLRTTFRFYRGRVPDLLSD